MVYLALWLKSHFASALNLGAAYDSPTYAGLLAILFTNKGGGQDGNNSRA